MNDVPCVNYDHGVIEMNCKEQVQMLMIVLYAMTKYIVDNTDITPDGRYMVEIPHDMLSCAQKYVNDMDNNNG